MSQRVSGTQIEGIELLHQGKWGAIGGFGPDFHLNVCLAPELKVDYRWQK